MRTGRPKAAEFRSTRFRPSLPETVQVGAMWDRSRLTLAPKCPNSRQGWSDSPQMLDEIGRPHCRERQVINAVHVFWPPLPRTCKAPAIDAPARNRRSCGTFGGIFWHVRDGSRSQFDLMCVPIGCYGLMRRPNTQHEKGKTKNGKTRSPSRTDIALAPVPFQCTHGLPGNHNPESHILPRHLQEILAIRWTRKPSANEQIMRHMARSSMHRRPLDRQSHRRWPTLCIVTHANKYDQLNVGLAGHPSGSRFVMWLGERPTHLSMTRRCADGTSAQKNSQRPSVRQIRYSPHIRAAMWVQTTRRRQTCRLHKE